MAKKKRISIAKRLGVVVSDAANAVSVAATGSEIGILELAAEDELKLHRTKSVRKVRAAPKRKTAAKKPSKPVKSKRSAKRR